MQSILLNSKQYILFYDTYLNAFQTVLYRQLKTA